MLRLTIDTTDFEKLARKIPGFAKRLESFREPLEQAGIYFLRQIGIAFEREGRDSKWPPLKPSTIASRRKGKGSGSPKPLRDTGRLAQSFERGKRGNIFRVSDLELRVGSNVEYAGVHQFGSVKANIPARPMIEVLPEDVNALTRIFEDYLNEQIGDLH